MTVALILGLIGWACGVAFCVCLAVIAARSDQAISRMRRDGR